jgi:hypothetical protein
MLIIYNSADKRSIQIDDSLSHVKVSPQDWDLDNPLFKIELKGIIYSQHAATCEDCSAFMRAFGTRSPNWHIFYNNQSYRLDLSQVGQGYYDNAIKCTIGSYEYGTRLNLVIDTDTVENLTLLLEANEILENYESCCLLLEKINGVGSSNKSNSLHSLEALDSMGESRGMQIE